MRSREQIELGIWSHTGVTGLRRFLCTCVSERGERCVAFGVRDRGGGARLSCLDWGCGAGRLSSVVVREGCIILLVTDGHDAPGGDDDDDDRGRVAAQCGWMLWDFV